MRFSFKTKMALTGIAISTLALLIACAGFIAYELRTYRDDLATEHTKLAEVVAINAAAAVAFEDVFAVDENVSVFSRTTDVRAAGVWSGSGELLATYADGSEADLPDFELVDATSVRTGADAITIVTPIRAYDEVIGTLAVQIGYDRVREKLTAYLRIAAEVLLVALLVAGASAQLAARLIAKPIARLSRTMSEVERTGNYAARVDDAGRDEFAALARGFNDMLARVHNHSDRLESAVAERTAEFRAEKERAEAASVAKSEFLANMSHEIRTPLNGVLGMTQVLLRSGLTEKQHEIASVIDSSGTHLLLLLNDLLDVSKIEAGKLELVCEAFDAGGVAHEVAALLRGRVEGRPVELHERVVPGGPKHLLGDPGRLRQVMMNLVGNAVKFTDEGHVLLSVETLPRRDDRALLRVRVEDTGIGIPADRLDAMFEKFEQADNSKSRAHEGTGLGLAISRSLIELMGGCLRVESTLGEGSCFWFEIELAVAEADELAEENRTRGEPDPAPNAKDRRPRVLVVDDNAVNRMVIVQMIDHRRYELDVAEDGRIAVEKVENERPDLVIMDVSMPVMDGLEATRLIRQGEAATGLPRLPIIAATAHARQEDHDSCLAAGMDDVLTKPMRIDNLRATLTRWLSADPDGESASARLASSDLEPSGSGASRQGRG